MKASGSQKIRTGIFTLIGLTLLIGAVFLIGKTKNMFGETFHIYGTFKNVGGLQVGNNIRFVGINVGTVQSIKIISDTLARVDMIIEKKANDFIKKNAIASIGSDGLMGDKLITIAATSEGSVPIKNGERIETEDPADLSKMMTKVQHIADNAEVITASLADIATQISEGKGSIGRLLYSDHLAKNLEGTVSSLKEGTQGFSENMKALKGNFLLKGYYKKKEKKKQEALDKANNAAGPADTKDETAKPNRAQRRAERKEERKEKKAEQ
jgi:phospholipid/cholesterol/gamma-HCH transport system substrate-binding protein